MFPNTGTSQKTAMRIEADNGITVYAMNMCANSTDGTAVRCSTELKPSIAEELFEGETQEMEITLTGTAPTNIIFDLSAVPETTAASDEDYEYVNITGTAPDASYTMGVGTASIKIIDQMMEPYAS